jgi:hypothetical protein
MRSASSSIFSLLSRTLVAAFAVAAMTAAAPEQVSAQDEGHLFNLSLFNPLQVQGEGEDIYGFRLGVIYTKNANVTGFDWSFVANHVTGNFKGVQMGMVGYNEGDFTGWGAGAVNIIKGDMYGLQTGLFNQVNTGRGVQASTFNHAKTSFRGLQFGIVNYAQTIDGVQVGLINIIKSGGQFPVFPIVNWGKS